MHGLQSLTGVRVEPKEDHVHLNPKPVNVSSFPPKYLDFRDPAFPSPKP